MIINSWGDCPVAGDCLADIAPPGGDGVVNSADLSKLLSVQFGAGSLSSAVAPFCF
jgi:hypothetical protein